MSSKLWAKYRTSVATAERIQGKYGMSLNEFYWSFNKLHNESTTDVERAELDRDLTEWLDSLFVIVLVRLTIMILIILALFLLFFMDITELDASNQV